MQHIFNAKRTHIEHTPRRLSQLDDPAAVCFASRKMQVAHLCDGMAEKFIHRALCCLTAVKMGNRDAQHGGGSRSRKHLISVTQHQHQLRPMLREILCKGIHCSSGGFGHAHFSTVFF